MKHWDWSAELSFFTLITFSPRAPNSPVETGEPRNGEKRKVQTIRSAYDILSDSWKARMRPARNPTHVVSDNSAFL